MNAFSIGLIFTVTWLVLAIPTLIILLRSYTRTQMSGFLWLVGAIVVWPFIARTTPMLLPVLSAAFGLGTQGLFGVAGLSIYVLISLVESLIGGALLLTALFILDRELAARTPNRSPVAPPAAPPAPPAQPASF